MTVHGALHPKSDVDRIYVPCGKGGRGLISCEGCIRAEGNGPGWYINNSSEQLLPLTKDSKVIETDSCKEPDEFKQAAMEELRNTWREKKMYVQLFERSLMM